MTPDEHAAKALDTLARSVGNPTNARDAIAIAQVHATLATRPAASGMVPAELLHQAELDLELARARSHDFYESFRALEAKLNQHGQDFTGTLDDIVDRVGELMETAYNSDRAEEGTS